MFVEEEVSEEIGALDGFCPHPCVACALYLRILGSGCGHLSRDAFETLSVSLQNDGEVTLNPVIQPRVSGTPSLRPEPIAR